VSSAASAVSRNSSALPVSALDRAGVPEGMDVRSFVREPHLRAVVSLVVVVADARRHMHVLEEVPFRIRELVRPSLGRPTDCPG
jgi:hypothetical protein